MKSESTRKAPQAPPTFPTTHTAILGQTENLIQQWLAAQDRLVRDVRLEDATFANTILPLVDIENSVNIHAPILTLYEVTSTHLDIGKASSEARKLFDGYRSERMKRQDLYDLVHAVWERREDVDPESSRLLERMHQSCIKNGLHISNGSGQQRFEIIENHIHQLAIEFRQNRSTEAGSIWLSLKELEGVPQDVLSKLETGQGEHEGKVRLCLDNPDHCDISVYVKNGEARKKIEVALTTKCVQNVPLLKEAVVLRDEAARLLGYKSHAELRLESRMAKTPGKVKAFLDDLRSRLVVNGQEDLEKLKEIKKNDLESRGEPFDGRFYPWDYGFYNRLIVKKRHSIDRKKVAEYFEIQTTVQGMLHKFESLFGLQFHNISSQANVWDESVQVYSAWDEQEEGGEFLGYLYLDLFAREGKDVGNFNYTLQPGFRHRDGTRQFPSTGLFCSFSKSTHSKPCLLSQHNLVMLFHELGHGIHNLVSKTTYSRFHGTNAAIDFGEAPSQMLENWCWAPSSLKSLGRHYSSISPEFLKLWKDASNGEVQPPAQISDEMIEGIISSKYSAKPNFLLGQLLLSMFDLKIHHPESKEAVQDMDLMKEYNNLIRDVQMFDISEEREEWSSFFVMIGHLMNEYDAGYYSYLFSQVYSTDMFYAAFKDNPMNKEEGRRYRKVVLEKGGSQDEMKSLKEFLGRDPSIEAFCKDLGMD